MFKRLSGGVGMTGRLPCIAARSHTRLSFGLLRTRPTTWSATSTPRAMQDEATSGIEENSSNNSSPTPTSTSTPEAAKAGDDDYFGAQELVQELTDPTAFGKSGEVWFFAQIATLLLIIFPPIPLQGLIDFAGVLSLTAGSVFILYALLSLGRNLSPMPKPRKTHSLVTTGMYSYIRHPMYGGLLLAAVGMAAVTRSEARLALAILLWFIFEKKTWFEEKALCDRYPQYEEYKMKVKKFIPFLY